MTDKKLKVIYEPKGPAREYTALALNLYNGCTHGCVYCYNNGRFGNKGDFYKSAKPRLGIVQKVVGDCRILKDKYGDNCPEIHLTFLGDAYQPAEKTLGLTGMIIRQLIGFNLPFTILTKSSTIKRDIDLLATYRKFRLGMSFTSVDQREANDWEPGTGYIQDRIEVLRRFKYHGIKTWVSLEPVMSVRSTIKVIDTIHRHVDLFKIGALNHMDPPEPINLAEAHREIMEALDFRHCLYQFKESLTNYNG